MREGQPPTPNDFERLVREWQGPLYNLSYRTLGNEQDAADASQEVFLTLFRKLHRYDPARPLKPWIYALAHNVLLNFLRGRKRRHSAALAASSEPARLASEAAASPERSAVFAATRSEERDLVAHALGDLPVEERLLLLLHYQHEVPQTELAASLGVPRTTLQTRLERGLARLRERLATLGLPAVAFPVEVGLREMSQVQVPAMLSTKLAHAAAAAKLGGAGGSLGATIEGAIGVLVMSKKMAVVWVIGCALVAAAGAWGGRALLERDFDAARREARASSEQSAAHTAQLAREVERLTAESERLRLQLAEANTKIADANSLHAAPTPEVAATPTAGAKETPTTGTPGDGIDWQRLSEAVAGSIDLLHGQFSVGDRQPITPDEQARLMGMLNEFTVAVQRARQRSAFPIFDEEIFPDLAEALYGRALGLSPEQLHELERLARETLERELAGADPARMSPLERSLARDRLLAALREQIATILDAEQQPALSRVSMVMEHLLEGSRRVMRLDIKGWSDEQVVETIVNEWRSVFALEETDFDRIVPIAASFLADVRRILQAAVPASDPAAADGGEERFTDLELAMIRAQGAAEMEIVPLLSDAQLERVANATPVYLLFNERGMESRTERHLPSF